MSRSCQSARAVGFAGRCKQHVALNLEACVTKVSSITLGNNDCCLNLPSVVMATTERPKATQRDSFEPLPIIATWVWRRVEKHEMQNVVASAVLATLKCVHSGYILQVELPSTHLACKHGWQTSGWEACHGHEGVNLNSGP